MAKFMQHLQDTDQTPLQANTVATQPLLNNYYFPRLKNGILEAPNEK